MEKYRCKLCSRSFINGRALGGHMKSHMMNLYASRKDPFGLQTTKRDDYSTFDSDSSYSSTSDEEDCEEDSSFDAAVVSVVLQDGESETDSSKKKKKYPTCGRSKRARKSRTCDFERMKMKGFFQVKRSKCFEEEMGKNVSVHCSSCVETEPARSIFDVTPEEDLAYCLIMLSKDKWERDHKFEYRARIRIGEERKSSEEDDYSVQKVTRSNKVRGKYKCEACDKLFRSYQALGGHRASHKRIIGAETGRSGNSGGGSKTAVVPREKVHKCPFCPRVFISGQALGGHKRTHFIAISRNVVKGTNDPLIIKPYSRVGKKLSIDLNLPAPFNDDEYQ